MFLVPRMIYSRIVTGPIGQTTVRRKSNFKNFTSPAHMPASTRTRTHTSRHGHRRANAHVRTDVDRRDLARACATHAARLRDEG